MPSAKRVGHLRDMDGLGEIPDALRAGGDEGSCALPIGFGFTLENFAKTPMFSPPIKYFSADL